ncbi:hypothetical protein [Tepidibacter hydrothermalis]|uniref:Uncharacterized protein n=1 Tax=Tepidibacter hydrothermalis TaxID=3036126 RepID=A0ABY8EJF2_9FIRM|nr:hypothetical protein [Tepidibacter hydrothermalis]WFD12119.1 hypothetical protein P4S50_08575 [Tepidibacter hydrothermalis]
MQRYIIIRSDNNSISQPMNIEEAVSKVENYDKQGIFSYIVSESEGNRLSGTQTFDNSKLE